MFEGEEQELEGELQGEVTLEESQDEEWRGALWERKEVQERGKKASVGSLQASGQDEEEVEVKVSSGEYQKGVWEDHEDVED